MHYNIVSIYFFMCCIDVKLAYRGHQADKNEMNGTNDRILIFFCVKKLLKFLVSNY